MRRWLVCIAACLVFGAITTMAAAWWCALYSIDERIQAIDPSLRPRMTLTNEDEAWIESRGITFRADAAMGPNANAVTERGRFATNLIWTGARVRAVYEHIEWDDGTSAMDRPGFILFAGWPFETMAGEQIRNDRPPGYRFPWAISMTTERSTVTRRGGAGMTVKVSRPLPLRPLWPGFAVSTLAFGAAILELVLIMTLTRQLIRYRRGRCPRCAYDLRGQLGAGCPECGWNREEGESHPIRRANR